MCVVWFCGNKNGLVDTRDDVFHCFAFAYPDVYVYIYIYIYLVARPTPLREICWPDLSLHTWVGSSSRLLWFVILK